MADKGLAKVINDLDDKKSAALLKIISNNLPKHVDLSKPESFKDLSKKDIQKIVEAIQEVVEIKKKASYRKYRRAADMGRTPEAAKNIFDAYRKEHPDTSKKWQDFYEKGDAKKSKTSDEDLKEGLGSLKKTDPKDIKQTEESLTKDMEDNFRKDPVAFASEANKPILISSGIALAMSTAGMFTSFTAGNRKSGKGQMQQAGVGIALGLGSLAVLGIGSMSQGKKVKAANKVFNEEMSKPENKRDNDLLKKMYKTGLVDPNDEMDRMIDDE